MARPSSVLCPSCGTLVGVNDPQCLSCGRRNPGLWGFAHVLRNLGDDMGFTGIVLFACGALYLASLAADPGGIGGRGLLGIGSPSLQSLELFGASGWRPVFGYGRWWTVLSAGWLHGGILHIVFNMMAVRNLAPAVAHLYGPGRTVIVYTVAGVVGFAASTLAGLAGLLLFRTSPLMLRVMGSFAGVTLGASASIMGLVGALWYYGRRGGSSHVSQYAKGIVVWMVVMGFMIQGIDNWAHLGGFAGGFLAAKLLDPLKPERGDHVLAALACLVLSALAVALSVVTGRALLS